MSRDDSANTNVADANSLFKARGKRVKIYQTREGS